MLRPMAYETVHFLEAVRLNRDVLVTGEQARLVMEVYLWLLDFIC
jgi:scyllo-inositol 2-dehydrogenase (NAD+)